MSRASIHDSEHMRDRAVGLLPHCGRGRAGATTRCRCAARTARTLSRGRRPMRPRTPTLPDTPACVRCVRRDAARVSSTREAAGWMLLFSSPLTIPSLAARGVSLLVRASMSSIGPAFSAKAGSAGRNLGRCPVGLMESALNQRQTEVRPLLAVTLRRTTCRRSRIVIWASGKPRSAARSQASLLTATATLRGRRAGRLHPASSCSQSRRCSDQAVPPLRHHVTRDVERRTPPTPVGPPRATYIRPRNHAHGGTQFVLYCLSKG
jgi:hypothetical protein